jgi:hypothetical protein
MKNGIILAGIVFAVALAVTVGNRLSNEAMAVVVGAVCGISASIPMALGLSIAASQNWGRAPSDRQDYESRLPDRRGYAPQPPVVIVSPPQHAERGMYPYANSPYSAYFPSTPNDITLQPRQFKIVGEE